jgi:Mn-containing catalase
MLPSRKKYFLNLVDKNEAGTQQKVDFFNLKDESHLNQFRNELKDVKPQFEHEKIEKIKSKPTRKRQTLSG